MNKVPTAEEFMKQNNLTGAILEPPMYYWERVHKAFVEFAKLHRKAILEAAANNATLTYRLPDNDKLHGKSGFKFVATKESILNTYPENLIK